MSARLRCLVCALVLLTACAANPKSVSSLTANNSGYLNNSAVLSTHLVAGSESHVIGRCIQKVLSCE
jgi:starvation-inducible outer membrane lipoprotein